MDEKSRIGDWEFDTIIGKSQKTAVVSIVERKSKFTILKKVNRKTAKNVTEAMIEGLKTYATKVLTIIGDNGSEFAYHDQISNSLDTDFYFAHPYASWERGLNENTNGLVRQYLKKDSCFAQVTDSNLINIMNSLNNRPRKSLGYYSPTELFKNIEQIHDRCL